MSDSCEIVMRRHLDAVKARNVDALVADYADDAVIAKGSILIEGKHAIANAFAKMPADLSDAPVIDSAVTVGEYYFVVWHIPGGPQGSDLFHIREGKIVFQAVAIHGHG